MACRYRVNRGAYRNPVRDGRSVYLSIVVRGYLLRVGVTETLGTDS